MPDHLIPPHGGKLVSLLVDPERGAELKAASRDWPSWDLTPRQLSDLELLLTGGFSPLQGFLSRADYESVCASMRLADGTLWPIPVTLDVPEDLARTLRPGQRLALRDPEGALLAALEVGEVWRPDRLAEAQAVYGTTSPEHPGVARLLEDTHPFYAGGRLEGLQLPVHYDARQLRLTPRELRAEFLRLGWRRVLAFQPRGPIHRAEQALTLRAAKELEANLLLHPAVGAARPGDVEHYTRLRSYQAVLPRFPQPTVTLALLPLALRQAGPREAVWHALIRKNYGCTHFMVGPDHADPGAEGAGRRFYAPAAAQELFQKHEQEIGVRLVASKPMVYVEDLDSYVPADEVPSGARALALSGAELIPEFTGVSDPYEPPRDADLSLDTTDLTPEEAAQEVLLHLEREGYVGVNGPSG